MDSTHTILRLRGAEVAPYLDDAARLRIAVFADWPYLYRGDLGYERDYLAAYAESPDSVFVLAQAQGAIVGVSTGLPLGDDGVAFAQPFTACGMPVGQVFYFGESVLLREWRGHGIGHAFFDQREAHARALGHFRWTAFCAVDRADDDPRRPADYRSNDAFWRKRGYARRPGMTMWLDWDEAGVGEADIDEVRHPLTFWLRDWGGAS